MAHDVPIARRQLQIEDAFGLRMRIAAEFVCLAGRFRADVWIIHGGRRYNGRSMRDLLNMVADCGSRLDLEAEGPDAEEAIAALAQAVRPLAGEALRCGGPPADAGDGPPIGPARRAAAPSACRETSLTK